MNYKIVCRIVSFVLLIEAAFMLVPLFFGIAEGDKGTIAGFGLTILIIAAAGAVLLCASGMRKSNTPSEFYAQEGFVSTGLSWIAMSLAGCLPFVISGAIPNFIDALFEMVSGFSTTGASILPDPEVLSKGMLYWRSFSHWLGGMGVLVFMMALLPAAGKSKNSDIYLLRAESPGPSVEKFTPHMRSTALILYVIYIFLTVFCIIFLRIGKMPWFDAVCLGLGTAGTGGFGIKADSLASYTPFAQVVTTIFMVLFGVNFNIYYLIFLGKLRTAFKNQELKYYIGIWLAATAGIFINTFKMYPTWGETLRHAAFQTASVMTTTGYSTTDFEQWGMLSKSIMLVLMCIGASAGSTGGGMKVSRVLLLVKSLRANVRKALHPNRALTIQMDGRAVSEQTISSVSAYLVAYVFIIIASFVMISIDNESLATSFSAVIACFNNIGPGFDAVGATGNYSAFSAFSKLVLIADMLLGRLEIYPLLVMLSRSAWDRKL